MGFAGAPPSEMKGQTQAHSKEIDIQEANAIPKKIEAYKKMTLRQFWLSPNTFGLNLEKFGLRAP